VPPSLYTKYTTFNKPSIKKRKSMINVKRDNVNKQQSQNADKQVEPTRNRASTVPPKAPNNRVKPRSKSRPRLKPKPPSSLKAASSIKPKPTNVATLNTKSIPINKVNNAQSRVAALTASLANKNITYGQYRPLKQSKAFKSKSSTNNKSLSSESNTTFDKPLIRKRKKRTRIKIDVGDTNTKSNDDKFKKLQHKMKKNEREFKAKLNAKDVEIKKLNDKINKLKKEMNKMRKQTKNKSKSKNRIFSKLFQSECDLKHSDLTVPIVQDCKSTVKY
jgi:hypothetical protein